MDAPKKYSVQAVLVVADALKQLAAIMKGDERSATKAERLLRPAPVDSRFFLAVAGHVPRRLGMVWLPRRTVVLGQAASLALRPLLKELLFEDLHFQLTFVHFRVDPFRLHPVHSQDLKAERSISV